MLWVLLASLLATSEDGLAQLKALVPQSQAWDQWLQQSGESPPDFKAIPSRAVLPGPLDAGRFGAGAAISTPDQWPARRAHLMQSLQHWILGTIPPPPDNLQAQVVDQREEAGAIVRNVVLRFGPNQAATLRLELMIPKGRGPFPVFLTQTNHRAWALVAVRRGYAGCTYAGCDLADDTDTFAQAYPGYDWSRLMRRAWAAARCVDYLQSVPEVRADQIALTGHSRNGKTSLMASALDPRIAVVISSSSGTGGVVSCRYHGEHHGAEGIESITRTFPEWFHPRFRFFSGREDKLPVDLTDLVALSAPRPCLISTALNDTVESTWSIQQTLLAVKPVYELLGAPDKLRILWRPGGHETWPTLIERYVDWCDLQFGRGACEFPERMIHPWDWDAWRKLDPAPLDPKAYPARPFETAMDLAESQVRKTSLPNDIAALLGTAPGAPAAPGTYGLEVPHVEELLRRAKPPAGLVKQDVVFGEYINADVYRPANVPEKEKLPVVLWLHPWTCPSGFTFAYKRGESAHLNFAKAGYAVFCYDQVGFGRRVEEVEGFYSRYPNWSLLGKMVRDAQAALDAIEQLPNVDPSRIYVVGYSFGALVGLHLAALDARPAGFAFACPPIPFRLDTDPERTGGIQRWSHLYMAAPRLGYFVGMEERVPYDIDELMISIAPKPLLLVTPKHDREAPAALTEQVVGRVKAAYALNGASGSFANVAPKTYNHFDTTNQQPILDWLNEKTVKCSTEEKREAGSYK